MLVSLFVNEYPPYGVVCYLRLVRYVPSRVGLTVLNTKPISPGSV